MPDVALSIRYSTLRLGHLNPWSFVEAYGGIGGVDDSSIRRHARYSGAGRPSSRVARGK